MHPRFFDCGVEIVECFSRIRQSQCDAEANCRMFLDIRQSRLDVEANYRMFFTYSIISAYRADHFAFLGISRLPEKKETVEMREFISDFHCLLFVHTLKLMTFPKKGDGLYFVD